jgi:hypothetical protein
MRPANILHPGANCQHVKCQNIHLGVDFIGEAVAPKTDAPRAAYAWKPLDSLMPRG